LKALHTDLDGMMVGPHGNSFAAADRTPTLTPARALLELHRAGVALVLVSGRTRRALPTAPLEPVRAAPHPGAARGLR
jgi:hypothetical protein